MIPIDLWLRLEKKISCFFGKSKQWPPGYLRFVALGNRKSFNIFTHMTKEELLFLYTVALTLPNRSFMVEIGSYLGASSCFLGAAARENQGYLYCIDTWDNQGMSEGPRETYQQFLKNTVRYQQSIFPIRAKSEEAATSFKKRIDLLFIDGDHDYKAVRNDLNWWLPKMRSDGWLIMHDWGWADGIKRAIREIVVPLQASNPMILPNMYATRINFDR